MNNRDLVIIGGGPAGLAAAIEAKNNGVKDILVIERDVELGGILQQCIHNGFGLMHFKEELTGPEYAERFIEALKAENIEYRLNTMVLELTNSKELMVSSAAFGIEKIRAKSVILAMGCRERTAGAIAMPGHRPAGVLTAGTAQRYMNMEGLMVGKRVVILGSGDIGLIMARRMVLEGAKVLAVVELMPYSGGLIRNIVQCLSDYDIPLLVSHTITDIRGKHRVEGVTIQKVDENLKPIDGTEVTYACDTILLSVGLIPENELSRAAGIALDPKTKGSFVNQRMQTSADGIFACGNVVHVHDLVDFVTEESMRAGRFAAKYVLDELPTAHHSIKTQIGKGITYIVPQSIDLPVTEDKVTLFMRPKTTYHNAEIVVTLDNIEIKREKHRRLMPGEMIKIVLNQANLHADNDHIKVSILGEEVL